MRKPLLLLPAVVLFAIGPVVFPAPAPQESKSASKAGDAAQSRAKKIYEVDCALCHGPAGDGKTDLAKDMQLNLSDLTDPKTLESKTDQQLFDLIRKGKDKMPGEDEGRAKNDEVKAIIQYLRTLSKDHPAAPAAPAATTATTNPAPSSN
jgi:mono/diheme cytochrome c family protein